MRSVQRLARVRKCPFLVRDVAVLSPSQCTHCAFTAQSLFDQASRRVRAEASSTAQKRDSPVKQEHSKQLERMNRKAADVQVIKRCACCGEVFYTTWDCAVKTPCVHWDGLRTATSRTKNGHVRTRARRWTLRTVTPFSECVWWIGGHKRISVDEPKDETLVGASAVNLWCGRSSFTKALLLPVCTCTDIVTACQEGQREGGTLVCHVLRDQTQTREHFFRQRLTCSITALSPRTFFNKWMSQS